MIWDIVGSIIPIKQAEFKVNENSEHIFFYSGLDFYSENGNHEKNRFESNSGKYARF